MSKQRITVPTGSIAVIVSTSVADELLTLARAIRSGKARLQIEQGHIDLAGDLILAIIETGVYDAYDLGASS